MGMIEGVSRPALAAILPNVNRHTLLLDVGANMDTKPNHLREFAVMDHFYAQMIFGIAEPRVCTTFATGSRFGRSSLGMRPAWTSRSMRRWRGR